MKLTDQVYLVGSGNYGISHDLDSNIYVVDCGEELAMIDAGGGCDVDCLVVALFTADALPTASFGAGTAGVAPRSRVPSS